MDILIVGGNSFIGSNLTAHLLGRYPSYNMINIDSSRNRNIEELLGIDEFQGRYSFKEGDICELSTYEHYLKVSDVVINCASVEMGSHFKEGMGKYIKTNIQGARMLADSAFLNKVPLLHISSDEVYGSCPYTVHRREENAPLDPTNSFAATVAAGERLVSIAGRRSGVPVVIARPCEVLGPNQSVENIVPRTIRSVMNNKPPLVRDKGGERYRDWIHVFDVCSALEILIESLTGSSSPISSDTGENVHSHPGGTVISGTSVATAKDIPKYKGQKRSIVSGVSIFNITAEMRYTITEVVSKVMELMGSELPLQESMEEGYKDIGYNPSGRKISYQGWTARYNDIDEILRSTIDWYNENPEVLQLATGSRLMP